MLILGKLGKLCVRGINSQIPLHTVVFYIYYMIALVKIEDCRCFLCKIRIFLKQGLFCMSSPQRAAIEAHGELPCSGLMSSPWRAFARLASCFRSDHDFSPWRAGLFAVASEVRMTLFLLFSKEILHSFYILHSHQFFCNYKINITYVQYVNHSVILGYNLGNYSLYAPRVLGKLW